MSLDDYNKKRDFDKTAEPRGDLKKSHQKELIFVVQKHHASHLHYDFRLELGGVLVSWAVPKGPSLNPDDKRLAMKVEDHPYSYRNFEGTIPKGNYGAGEVIVWDNGSYEPVSPADDPSKALKAGLMKGHLSFILHGQKLRGEFSLIKSPHMGENAWLLLKKDDEFASKEDVTRQTNSVLSSKTLDTSTNRPEVNAPEKSMPARVKPMLATLTEQAFDNPDWIYEIKWDGYRAIGAWDGSVAELYSRNGNDFSARYGPIHEALRDLAAPAVLDGEIVMVDAAGKPHFELLQNYQRGSEGTLLYYVFDILWYDGKDLQDLPLLERKRILQELLGDNTLLRYSDHIEANGRQFYKTAEAGELEGIMAKHKDSTYRQGRRSKQWLKVKTHKRQEVVIGGFTEPRGSRKHIGALVVGVYKDGALHYVGHTGGGILTEQLKPLREELEKLERDSSPFSNRFKPNAPVHWVEPKLICEVTFGEWTSDGHMRQPIFVGMRSDKDPHTIHKEVAGTEPPPDKPVSPEPPAKPKSKPSAARVTFTHEDKVFWPERGYTKGDLINYYQQVSEVMLPYLQDRPCNLLRHPNGYQGKSFFQKDMGSTAPEWAKTVSVYSESNRKNIDYFVCDGLDALLYMVQLGSIEINPWSSRLPSLDKPDWAVIDLDPEGIEFPDVIKTAMVVHDVCEELHIPSYPKTSGKTGIHIFIPMQAKYSYEQVRQFSELLANIVQSRLPEITSVERNPRKRQHKIYLDFLQNRESQTLAAPYSVRPILDASVSAPLHWDEVKPGLTPSQFTIKNMAARLQSVGDLWQPVLGSGVDLQQILDQAGA
jgi:bifunctional non-homologous end joining protein LigD